MGEARIEIFPARVGMNPKRPTSDKQLVDFPRASGDEPPTLPITLPYRAFSPREWG